MGHILKKIASNTNLKRPKIRASKNAAVLQRPGLMFRILPDFSSGSLHLDNNFYLLLKWQPGQLSAPLAFLLKNRFNVFIRHRIFPQFF